MKLRIKVADYACPVMTLGPGKRFVLWVQGCCFDCPGCTSPEWRSLHGGADYSVKSLSELIIGYHASSHLEGLTISGGEPMLQANGLFYLWSLLREKYPQWTLFLYTGFTFKEIRESSDRSRMDLMLACDVIVDGRYLESLNNGRGLRGSTNQEFIIRNPRYFPLKSFFESCERSMEWRFTDTSFLFAGVPPLGFKDAVSNAIKSILVSVGEDQGD